MRPSAIHGRGLFARLAIAKGEIVCIRGGHIFDRRRLAELQPDLGPAEVQITDDLFIGPARAEDREGGMIFSNHSCAPSIGVRGQIVFVAMRDVEAGEELTHDWAMTDDDSYEMSCRCGAASCRGVVTDRIGEDRSCRRGTGSTCRGTCSGRYGTAARRFLDSVKSAGRRVIRRCRSPEEAAG